VLTTPASSSVLSGSLLIKHLSLTQAQMPPCALAGIYLSTSQSSVDLSSQCSGELGIAVISATQIKNKAQRLNSTLRCFEETSSPASGCCNHRPFLLPLPSPASPWGGRELLGGLPKSSALSASLTPAEYRCLNLQNRRLHQPVATSYCWKCL